MHHKKLLAVLLGVVNLGLLGAEASSVPTASASNGCILQVTVSGTTLQGSCVKDSSCGENCKAHQFSLVLQGDQTVTQYWCDCPGGRPPCWGTLVQTTYVDGHIVWDANCHPESPCPDPGDTCGVGVWLHATSGTWAVCDCYH